MMFEVNKKQTNKKKTLQGYRKHEKENNCRILSKIRICAVDTRGHCSAIIFNIRPAAD